MRDVRLYHLGDSMKLILTARSRLQKSVEYTELQQHGLSASFEIADGIGSPRDPIRANIRIRNEGSDTWSGVIHVELPFAKTEPRFFLPAFMYGHNRGEAPQNVPNEFPRLRVGSPSRPSSPWWMVRSDRLSHPAEFVYDNGKIYGLCAMTYVQNTSFVKKYQRNGRMTAQFFYFYFHTLLQSLIHIVNGFSHLFIR